MTWQEIKKAVEKTGISDSDEISIIQCEPHDGAKSFHVLKIGKNIRLVEDFADSIRRYGSGCAS